MYRVDLTLTDARGNVTEYGSKLARVGASNREFTNAGLNRPLLERVAEVSGGAYWQADALDRMTDAITFGGGGIRTEELLPLWNVPLVFVVLLALKCTEWLLRRRWGSL